MADFQSFIEQKELARELNQKVKQIFREENTLRVIQNKKSKTTQYQKLQKAKNDLYWKLSEKLEDQLKEIKNHNTPEAREKLFLLEKCRNQKHIRRKTKEVYQELKENNYIPPKLSFFRPKSCCPKMLKGLLSDSLKLRLAQNKNQFPKESSCFEALNGRFQKIQRQCAREYSHSQQIKEGIDTAHYYQKLIVKNSSVIFTKIL